MTMQHEARASGAGGVMTAIFGALTYVYFLATFLCLIGFIADAPFLPKTINSGAPAELLPGILINGAALVLFGAQHSIMARPAFKRWWTQFVPKSAERSVYVLAATSLLVLLVYVWQPLPQTVWRVESPVAANAIWALFALGWGLVLFSTFLISHFELFGLQQAFSELFAVKAADGSFVTPSVYKIVRHPLYLGFIIAFWAAPEMSLGRLLFALGGTAYIFVGIYFEERDLLHAFGEKYLNYKKRVPMILPFGPK